MEEDGAVASVILSPGTEASMSTSPASQAKDFRRIVQDCSVHYLYGMYGQWSSCRGLNELSLRQGYVGGPLYPV